MCLHLGNLHIVIETVQKVFFVLSTDMLIGFLILLHWTLQALGAFMGRKLHMMKHMGQPANLVHGH